MGKKIASVALVIYLLVLFDQTLVRYQRVEVPPNFVPFRTIRFDLYWGGKDFVINFLGNIGVFMPVGLLAPAFWPGRRLALPVAAMSFGLSLMIEALQYSSGTRVADVDDLILNTLGGLVGYGAWLSAERAVRTMGRWRGRRVSPRKTVR